MSYHVLFMTRECSILAVFFSHIKAKRIFAIAKTKEQISCAAVQHLCFRYTESIIPLFLKSEISSF